MYKLKLGRIPSRPDSRTIKLSRILRLEKLVPPPESFDLDISLGGIQDNNMYLNDQLGDCVIAGRAHATLRYEKFEQGFQIAISDEEIKSEYFWETGGHDTGLDMLTSLKRWRNDGWEVGDKNYKIHAFASIDPANHEEVKQAIYLLRGIYLGFLVPQSAMDDFDAGKHVWDVVPGSKIIGGHCVYGKSYNVPVAGYNAIGPIVVTWGAEVQMTWHFFDTYCDEAYVIIDARDDWLGPNNPLDIAALDAILAEITNTPPDQPPTESPSLWQKIKTFFRAIWNWIMGSSY